MSLLGDVSATLAAAGVPHAVVGGAALAWYGMTGRTRSGDAVDPVAEVVLRGDLGGGLRGCEGIPGPRDGRGCLPASQRSAYLSSFR